MEANEITFQELNKNHRKDEAFILLGCGGDINEWINGITAMLHAEKAITSSDPDKVWAGAYTATTTGGRTDLVLMFPDVPTSIDVSRLAILRLNMCGDFPNSWLSDYLVNYATQHM